MICVRNNRNVASRIYAYKYHNGITTFVIRVSHGIRRLLDKLGALSSQAFTGDIGVAVLSSTKMTAKGEGTR